MKKLLFLIAVFLLIGSVTAFELNVDDEVPTASVDEAAFVGLEVTNTDNSEKEYRLNIQDYHRSSWYTYDDRVTVPPGETETVEIRIRPGEDSVQDRYQASISVRDTQTEEQRLEDFSFRVLRDRNLNLEEFSLGSEVYKPDQSIEAEISVRNVGARTLENGVLELTALNNTKTLELDPIAGGGLRITSAEFNVPRFEPPGEKTVELELEDRSYSKSFEVEEVRNLDQSVKSENKILYIEETFSYENLGNNIVDQSKTVKVPSYLAPIFSAPGAERIETDEGYNYTWNMELAPGESANFRTRTDYWIPLTGLIVVMASLIGIRKLTSGVSVTRTVSNDSKGIHVTLEVKNSSSRKYDDVVLEEYIPNIASVDTDFEMASPEVKHESGGTRLKWWINDLDSGDHRIFKYRIDPKVEVEEGITLKPSELKDGEVTLSETDEVDVEFKPE